MKKTSIIIILMTVLCGVGVNAQRPVGDTLNVGEGGYLYHPLYIDTTNVFNPFTGNLSSSDQIYSWYWVYYLKVPLMVGQITSFEQFTHAYPDLATSNAGRHITGQQFSTSETMMVIGLAVCPTIRTDVTNIIPVPEPSMLGPYLHVLDTTMANRETEYVQLYTIEGGQPQLQAEGAWRCEYPHRYLLFPKYRSWVSVPFIHDIVNYDTTYVPLYEVMFDTGVYIDGKTFMLAGTHNNNATVWSSVACDTVYTEPKICWVHYPTAYSSTLCGYNGDWWCRRDSAFSWGCYTYNLGTAINIFPILDTMFGRMCPAVSGLDTAGVDSVRATLMWSADARQHDWEVWYRPTGDTLDSGAVVTVAVPTVTLTGLVPGTEYSVAVRGRCDIDNYSPWSDTLLFTTPQDTTEVIDTTQTQGIQQLGNLDRFTRIMPNPASEVVNVLSSYRLESIAVYDLTGRLLLEQPAEGISAVVKVSALPRGTYIMAIKTQQGVATKKLVVVEGN